MLLLALPLLTAAQGPVPATFYNRPGATPATLAAELRRCRVITTRTHGGVGRALTPPIAVPGEDVAPARPATIADCMATRGWRRYALGDKDRAALEALAPDARAATLARLRAAECPDRGTLLLNLSRMGLRRR